MAARRKFTREFKESAARLVTEQGYSYPQAAKSLGVDAKCVRGWVARLAPGGGGGGGPGAAAELQRLRRENARLLMERDILKKAAAFFAREQP
jgi:transposase